MMCRIAILLASFNGEKYIGEQLDSILRQKGVGFHIFIRDDGSTDATLEIVKKYSKKFRNITLMMGGDRTGSAAGNFFWMLSHIDLNEYTHVALSDQDDIWGSQKLLRALELMESENADGYSSDLFSYSIARQQTNYIKKSFKQKPFDYLFQGASAGCTYVLSKELAENIGNKVFNVPSSEFVVRSHDWLIYAIARSSGCKWICDNQAHIFYRQHSTNVYGARLSFQGLVAKFNSIRSGWFRQNVIWLSKYLNAGKNESLLLQRVARWSFRDRLYLACHANQFRRRKREAWALAVFALIGVM